MKGDRNATYGVRAERKWDYLYLHKETLEWYERKDKWSPVGGGCRGQVGKDGGGSETYRSVP